MSYPENKFWEPTAPYASDERAPPPPYTPYVENPTPYPAGTSPNQPPYPTGAITNHPQPYAVYPSHQPIPVPSGTTHIIVSQSEPSCSICRGCDCEHRPRRVTSPTVVPIQPFHPRHDADALNLAIRGKTDKQAIIDILAKRTNTQRLEIAYYYKIQYRGELLDCLRQELKSKFENIIVGMLTPLPEFYAEGIYASIHENENDDTFIEVLCTLGNAEIRAVRKAYKHLYHKSLEWDLTEGTSCSFRHLMASLSTAQRDESPVTNSEQAHSDAKTLHKTHESRFEGSSSPFCQILTQRSYSQIRLTLEEYKKISGHKLQKTIKKEVGEELRESYLSIVKAIKNPAAYFASRMHKSKYKGNKSNLTRIVLTRCEIDMGDIKREYAEKYKKSLSHTLKNYSSGDYKKCLMELLGDPSL